MPTKLWWRYIHGETIGCNWHEWITLRVYGMWLNSYRMCLRMSVCMVKLVSQTFFLHKMIVAFAFYLLFLFHSCVFFCRIACLLLFFWLPSNSNFTHGRRQMLRMLSHSSCGSHRCVSLSWMYATANEKEQDEKQEPEPVFCARLYVSLRCKIIHGMPTRNCKTFNRFIIRGSHLNCK